MKNMWESRLRSRWRRQAHRLFQRRTASERHGGLRGHLDLLKEARRVRPGRWCLISGAGVLNSSGITMLSRFVIEARDRKWHCP